MQKTYGGIKGRVWDGQTENGQELWTSFSISVLKDHFKNNCPQLFWTIFSHQSVHFQKMMMIIRDVEGGRSGFTVAGFVFCSLSAGAMLNIRHLKGTVGFLQSSYNWTAADAPQCFDDNLKKTCTCSLSCSSVKVALPCHETGWLAGTSWL